MSETATRLPRARTPRIPAWLAALDVYKQSFNATSAETLIEGAEAFAEMSPDDQAFHQAHIAFRHVQALGDVFLVLRRIDARLAGLDPGVLAELKGLPTMKKALVSIARGQNKLLRLVADGGLADAVNGDNDDDDAGGDDDDDDSGDDDGDDDEGLDGEDDAVVVEDEDHGTGDAIETVVPEVLPAGARRPAPEPS